MKKLFTLLCALGIGSVSAQTFKHFEDATLSGTYTFNHTYFGSPATTTQTVRLWATVTGTTTNLANVTLTWAHAGVTVVKELHGVNNWGISVYQVEIEDLYGTATAGDWSLTINSDHEVFIHNWGVTALATIPLKPQFCPEHRDPGTLMSRGVIKGAGEVTQWRTNMTYIVYGHAQKNGPFHTWTNCAFTILNPQPVNKKDK